ncbi:hypothetical protein H4582DRAFT_1956758 [Lactarius indigo]|nr:hypothetical protein H4582DRAFT_1956758 [Lactarius indigo]
MRILSNDPSGHQTSSYELYYPKALGMSTQMCGVSEPVSDMLPHSGRCATYQARREDKRSGTSTRRRGLVRCHATSVAIIGKGIVGLPLNAHKIGIPAEPARMYVRARVYDKRPGKGSREMGTHRHVISAGSTRILTRCEECVGSRREISYRRRCGCRGVSTKGSRSESMMVREKGCRKRYRSSKCKCEASRYEGKDDTYW